jgi:SelR domain
MPSLKTWISTAVILVAMTVGIHFVLQWTSTSPAERRGIPMGAHVEKTDAEWKAQLTPEQYSVTRKKGTERSFTGMYWNTKKDGIYTCICCGQPLFDSSTKSAAAATRIWATSSTTAPHPPASDIA